MIDPIKPPAAVAPETPPARGGVRRPAGPGCSARSRTGERCYKRHPEDMSRWCAACLDGHDPEGPMPGWMGGVEVEPRPTFVDRFEVSAVGEAEWAGFTLGCNGFAVVGPAHYSPEELAAFYRGHEAGFRAFEEDEAEAWDEEEEHQAEAFGERDVHPAEVVEAIGAVEARKL